MDLDTRGGVFSIDTILHILRAEGFYASEAALQRELEDRFSHQDLDRNGRRESEDPGNEAVKSQEPRIEDKTDNQERGESESRVTHDSAKSRSEAADEKPYDESRLSQDDMQPREDDIRPAWEEQHEQNTAHARNHSGDDYGRSRDVPDQPVPSPWAFNQHHAVPVQEDLTWLEQGIDEYENEFDVGYVREYIRGQANFADAELDLSDDECSSRSMKLYHQALHGASSQDLSHTDGASEPPHSDIHRGASQISGRTSQGRRSLTPYSQVSGSSRGKSSISKDRSEIVLLGAVNPTTSQNVVPLVVPPLNEPEIDFNSQRDTSNEDTQYPETPVVQRRVSLADSPAAPSTGPASYALSHISSEYCVESPLIHEASFGKNFLRQHTNYDGDNDEKSIEARSKEPHSGEPKPDPSDPAQPLTGGIWPLGLIGTVGGALGKVFGRRNSEDVPIDAYQNPSLRPSVEESNSQPAKEIPSVEQSCESLRDLCVGQTEEDTLKLPETVVESIPSPSEDPPSLEAEPRFGSLQQLESISDEGHIKLAASNLDRSPSNDPVPGQSDLKEGGIGDANFSFPVTPASDGPATTEPGRVFGTWPSFGSAQSLPRKRQLKGDNMSRASSEYDPSGYSTDEGHFEHFSHSDWSRPSSRNDMNSSRPSSRNEMPLQGRGGRTEGTPSRLSHTQNHPPLAPLKVDDTIEDSSTLDDETPESQQDFHTPGALEFQPPNPDGQEHRHRDASSKSGQKGPFLGPVSPLDTTISLPAKQGLDLLSHARTGSQNSQSSYDTVPAYKPHEDTSSKDGHIPEYEEEDEGQQTHSARSGETGANNEEASGPADDYSSVVYHWDEDYLQQKYEIFDLKIIQRRRRTGFEECKDIVLHVNDLIAGRYQVTEFLGSAAFSQAVQAIDIKTGALVCLKIIKNNKDYLDQSLDEIKLLKYVNRHDPNDQSGILQLYDYFYYKEHLFLVCELLRANLYEFQKYNQSHGAEPYFILPRVQAIARQVLHSLAFMHSLDLIHCDLKPENILIKSYSRCLVKVIDLGSSCFTTDHLSSYVQSRSYRSPEVILGLPYSQKVDIWSVGCIISELLSGFVLLQNDSMSTLLARMEGILGPIPLGMLKDGRFTHRYYTLSGLHFEHNEKTERYELLRPKRTTLAHRIPQADPLCLQFLTSLLTIDPLKRPSAEEALRHPWLQYDYGYDYTR